MQGVLELIQLQLKSTVDMSDDALFDFLSVSLRPSCVAVGRNQQFIRWVVTPPAQHHTSTEHAQHLQEDGKGMKKNHIKHATY